jgi:hypothetical protein
MYLPRWAATGSVTKYSKLEKSMSYVITNSRGQVIAVVPPGTVNTSATSLSLVGQGVTDYGTDEIENYVHLCENFAAPAAPTIPILGQLWYDSSTDKMKVWNSGNAWANLASEAYVEAQKASPAFTGTPTAPTAAANVSTTQIATTAFVQAQKDSPAFTGTPTAPTANVGTSSTQIATTAFVSAAVVASVGNISGSLGTMASQNANAVAITGGTISGVTLSGSTLTGITTLAIAVGGTGATTASGARASLGLGTISTQNANNVSITGGSISALASAIAVVDGGTGATNAASARTNLGAAAAATVISAGSGLSGGGDLSTNRTISIASNSNGFGTRYISTSTPSGGSNGDIWYQI